ncbi:MAG: hypothetical protein AAGG48_00115 [Planctomycetota bacterium]
MSFNLGRITDFEGRLQRDYVEFARLWAAVKEDWLDDKCRKFEQTHLQSLGPSLNRFTGSLHEFCDAIRKAEADLRDDQRISDE